MMDNKVAAVDRIPGHAWWKQRSLWERRLALACFVILLVAFSLLIATIVTSVRLREFNSVCHTPECIQEASDIFEYIDPTVEPCDDFYEFVCGNFKRRTVVPDDSVMTSTIGNMQEDIHINLKKLVEVPVSSEDTEVTVKTKNLYASCMNSSIEDGSVDALREVLDRVGGWPIADTNWNQRDLNLERRLAILFVHGITPFIKGRVTEDEKNITDFVFNLDSGTLILRDAHHLNKSNPEYEGYLQSYKDMIIATARLLDADEATIQKDVEDLIRFERDYAKISEENSNELQAKRRRNDTGDYNERYTVQQLEIYMPKIEWGDFLDYIFEYLNINAKKTDVAFTLKNQYFLRSLTFLVRKTTPRTMANYLTWRFVYQMMPYLDIHFRRLYYDFRQEVPIDRSAPSPLSRWKECIGIVSEIFTMPLTSLYVKENFDTERKDEILDLIASLKRGWIGGIHNQKWLDLTTKNLCEEKLNDMTTKMGFPRYVLQPDELRRDFEDLKVSSDRLLDNMLKINRHNVKLEMSVLTGKKKRRNDWFRNPLGVNAQYDPDFNTIIFPLAMLRSPVFVPRRPKYINYGRLGVIIGHEIGHGFDTNGVSTYGEDEQWWEKEFSDKYFELVLCFMKQYSKFTIELTDFHVDGYRTLDDNIADYSGLQNSFRAYKMYESEHGEEPTLPGVPYSTPQVFFMKYGQLFCELLTVKGGQRYRYNSHSPGKQRVNVPLMNSEEFSKAFNCPSGSPMNPVEKCDLWG